MTVHLPVEGTQILLFARAIGDMKGVASCADSFRSGERGPAFAPPTFVVSSAQFDPDYALRPHEGVPWFGSADTPSGMAVDGTDGLHAEQHFEYRRPVVAGDVFRVSERDGETWDKTSRSGGVLHFRERITEYSDIQTGDVVVTARSVWVFPEA